MKIYRVVLGDQIGESTDSPLPHGTTETGYWSPHKQCIKNIINAHIEWATGVCPAGGLWPRELMVLIANSEDCMFGDPREHKTGENQSFDKDEVFVTRVNKFDKIPWGEFVKL